MCGIAGLLGVELGLAEAAAGRMRDALRHRGPDDWGIERIRGKDPQYPPAILAHTRLAILDLTPAGHQPMTANDEIWIAFNGEIYNFRELRRELEGLGAIFRTGTDTEVLLHGYRTWGERLEHKVRGMFAWCLLDKARGLVWLCRDRLGIKPLYLYRPSTGGLLFASELRALLAAGPHLLPPALDPQALESFLAQGAVYGPRTIVQGIRLLDTGTSLWTNWSGREERKRCYWSMPSCEIPGNADETVSSLSGTLREAVGQHLSADVPVGVFLSGGVDSAAVAALACGASPYQVRTLTIGFDQPQFDESAEAEQVAMALGTKHQTVRLMGADLHAEFQSILAALDQPTVDGFNSWFVSRAARQSGLKVALSGIGGDELFGGYPSFRDVPRALSLRGVTRWLGSAEGILGRLGAWAHRRGGAKAEALFQRPADIVEVYLLRRELFLPPERRLLQAVPEGSSTSNGLCGEALAALRAAAGNDGTVFEQVSRLELAGYTRQMLLRDADVCSMAHGLELRVPLLDHKVVETALRLPEARRRAGRHPKALLAEAAGPRMPAGILGRPKRGFTFPWKAWLTGPLAGWANRILAAPDPWTSIGFAPAAPAELLKRFQAGDPRVGALQIVALLVLADFVSRHGLVRSS